MSNEQSFNKFDSDQGIIHNVEELKLEALDQLSKEIANAAITNYIGTNGEKGSLMNLINSPKEIILNKFSKSKIKIIANLNYASNADLPLYSAIKACKKNCHNKEAIELLIKYKADINGKVYDPAKSRKPDDLKEVIQKDYPLTLAIKSGNEAIINMLLENPEINVNIVTSENKSPLFIAAEMKDYLTIELLLKKNAITTNLKDKIYGITPLLKAVMVNSLKCVEALLNHNYSKESYKPDANLEDNYGTNAFFMAVIMNNEHIVKLLLEKSNANINYVSSKSKKTALIIAIENKLTKIVEVLLTFKGIDFSIKDSNDRTAIDYAKDKKLFEIEILIIDYIKKAEEENSQTNKNYQDQDKDNITYDQATSEDFIFIKNNIINQILIEGKQLSELQNNADILHLAANKGLGSVIISLIKEYNFNINISNKNGNALHQAIATPEGTRIIQLLLDLNINLMIEDNHGLKAIHGAALIGNKNAINLIYEKNPKAINYQSSTGATPIHYAASAGRKYIVEDLYNKGAKIDIFDNYGKLPIHYANNALISGKNNKETREALKNTIKFLFDIHGFFPAEQQNIPDNSFIYLEDDLTKSTFQEITGNNFDNLNNTEICT